MACLNLPTISLKSFQLLKHFPATLPRSFFGGRNLSSENRCGLSFSAFAPLETHADILQKLFPGNSYKLVVGTLRKPIVSTTENPLQVARKSIAGCQNGLDPWVINAKRSLLGLSHW